MRVPLLIALNMMDMAADRQLTIDIPGLAKRLGCPVIPLTASKKQGGGRVEGDDFPGG